MQWIYRPDTHEACPWFLCENASETPVAWVCKQDGEYIVDAWNMHPPPNGPYKTLEAAKLAAEMLYG